MRPPARSGGSERGELDRQRLDKWLWHARVVRTRTGAATLIAAGHVRINGERNRSPSRAVRPGDVLTVALDRTVRVLKVAGFAERRGAADDARALFVDLTKGEAGGNDDQGPGADSDAESAG